MDPISQGTVGVAFAQSSASKNNILKISLIGLIAGFAPDADVVIKSSTDPILFLEYHRQFSHSLFFIPFGALIVAILFFPFFKSSLNFKQIYLASFLGYLTHGILMLALHMALYSIGHFQMNELLGTTYLSLIQY